LPPADRPDEHAADLALLTRAAQEAGELALGYFRKEPKSWLKLGSSPVSEADMAVDRLLTERLRPARPDYGWLSEETADSADRLQRRRLFVVDPIDGTREYLAGGRDWAVSVAVVEDGSPVAAALFAPARGWLFTATRGGGAFLGSARLALDRPRPGPPRATGPKRLTRRLAALVPPAGAAPYIPSLALRFAYVAAGRFEIALGSENSHDWDLAAADLVLTEAGGKLTDLAGAPVTYNREQPRHPALVGAAEPLHASLLRMLAKQDGALGRPDERS